MVYWGRKRTDTGEIESTEQLVQRVESLTHDTTEIKHDISLIKNDIETLKRDESELGNQVSEIQSGLNELVRKDVKLVDLCKEPCTWANDLQDQITSNGKSIDRLESLIGVGGGSEKSDILFANTKQVSITLTDQTLNGNFYYYDFEYDISEWDNAEYNLEGVIFKSIHKDAINGFSGDVEPSLRKKTLITISFDENKLYGTIQTPNIQDTTTGKYKLQVTCLWKKVL